jgi:hypothetical protein
MHLFIFRCVLVASSLEGPVNQPENLSPAGHDQSFPGPDDPPRDWEREEAAFARERDRLVRDHLGKFAVVYQDEVAGVYDTLGEAILEGYRRFGDVPIVFKEIRPEEPPDFFGIVDLNHPSMRFVDR